MGWTAWTICGFIVMAAGVSAAEDATPARAAEDATELFETRIRPALVDQCFRCHGGEKTAQNLRVDSREALIKGGDSGPAIVPGQPDDGLLLAAIEHRDGSDYQMPPGGKLPAETIAAFRTWIELGAPWPEEQPGVHAFQHARHWAFQPVRPVELPEGDPTWSDHPVDRFIAAAHREQGLKPAQPAERHVLIRRLYFDLIGLPPTPEELDAALADQSADAWERLINRLLESPHYGERWGRHWMDVVRYADTAGDNADYPIPEVRLYRDYIIDSFNADKPFDQFVREQVAGDLLAAETARTGGSVETFAEQTIATGFLALSRRYATAPYELWHLTLEDAIDTVGRSFLGLTFKCARCHDHKFDPVTMEDYYGLYGILAGTQFPWAGGEEFQSKQFGRRAFQPLEFAETVAPQLAEHAAAVEALKSQIRELEASNGDKEKVKALQKELRDKERRGVPDGIPCAYAVCEGTPADVPMQLKGDPGQPGPVVPRRMPQFLGLPEEPIPPGQSGRLQLANWLVRPDHPLTPRVMANRVWQQHFGQGLVATPSNFGTRGEPPSHPELLDFLAGYFVEQGWSIKSLHRLILTSRTWRQSSMGDSDGMLRDPDNKFLARFARRRLDAEAIRDALLSVAGTLDLNRPGEHPFPEITKWNWTQHTPFKDVYPSSHRSVYLMTQRLKRHPFLGLFDGPDTNTTTDLRTSSIVPLQALFWMNNPLVHEQSAKFGERMRSVSLDESARLRWGFLAAYGREPHGDDETNRYLEFVRSYRDELSRTEADPKVLEAETWASLARVILSANEFLYLD